MTFKTITASHLANYAEAWRANELVCAGKIEPTLSEVYRLDNLGEATRRVHHGHHVGKVGVLRLAPSTGPGIDDVNLRRRIGADRISLARIHSEAGVP